MSAALQIQDLGPSSAILRKLAVELPKFSNFVRQAAADRFKYITGSPNVVVEECQNWDDFCYGSQMALIMIAGKDLKVFFKAHFNVKPALATIALGKSTASLFDLFREYCNLTAGAIKQGMHEKKVLSGISLPIVTSGYDEIIFSDTVRKDRVMDCFVVKCGDFSFVATVAVDAGAEIKPALSMIEVAAPTEGSDDIEFM